MIGKGFSSIWSPHTNKGFFVTEYKQRSLYPDKKMPSLGGLPVEVDEIAGENPHPTSRGPVEGVNTYNLPRIPAPGYGE